MKATLQFATTSRLRASNALIQLRPLRVAAAAQVVAEHAVAQVAVEREAVDRAAEPELAEAAASLHNSNQIGARPPGSYFLAPSH